MGMTATKRCADCGIEKATSEFYPRSGRPGKFHPYCVPCHSARNRKSYLKNPEAVCKRTAQWYQDNKSLHRTLVKAWHTRNPDYIKQQAKKERWGKYGLTQEQYEQIVEAGCRICGSKKNPCLDHDHATGEVRGCLCLKCNIGLGAFRDDPKLMEAAIQYVQNPPERSRALVVPPHLLKKLERGKKC